MAKPYEAHNAVVTSSSATAQIRKSHFVLVHGSCHGAWCWYKLVTLLRSAGHRVTALDLAASGINPKQRHHLHTISDYFEPLTKFMADLPPEDKVVLVGHSMGGVAISVAMERFPHKVSVAVFVTAFMPGPDFTFQYINQEFSKGPDTSIDTQYTYEQGPDEPATSFLFGPKYMSNLYWLSPLDDLSLAMLLARPFPLFNDAKSIKETAVTKENYGSVHRVYIVSVEDKGRMKEYRQRWMIENNPPDEVKEISTSDHMVMLSAPQKLCSYLLAIAEKY